MKLLAKLLAYLALLIASPAFAQVVVVHEGGPESADVATKFAGAYNVQHANFYVNSSAAATIANLDANIATTTALTPVWVTIYADDISGGAYASAAAWVTALNNHIASLRAAVSGVKVAVITPLPKTGDATYSSRLRTVIGLLRAEEGSEIDRIIDFAANPSMNDKTAPTTQFADANKYSGNLPVDCVTACTLSDYNNPCLYTSTTGGSKGMDYLYKQYECSMQGILAGKYPWTVYEQPIALSLAFTAPTTDPAAYTLAQPDDIATTASTTGWTVNDVATACSGGCFPTLPPGAEKKFRTTGNGWSPVRADPVRAPFQTISGHCHIPFGSSLFAGNNTYKSLRTGGQGVGVSAMAGELLNPTAYWNPCLNKANALGDGTTRVKKMNYAIVYYVSWRNALTMWDVPRGLSYVFGTNMDNPDDTLVKARITSLGFVTYLGDGWTEGSAGWYCENTGVHAHYLANTDGSDPLSACPSSSKIYASVDGPQCWDGVNLRSASGYDHVAHAFRNNNDGQNQCWNNWYPIPQLQEKIYFSHQGASDYITWRLDSDDAAATAAGHAMRNGESFHGDWWGAWDYPTMVKWMHNCIASKSTSTDSFTPHECNYSTISSTERMLSNSPSPNGGRNPQVDTGLNFTGASASDWWDVPPTSATTTGTGHRRRARLHKRN